MRQVLFLVVILSLISCSTTQLVTYRPAGSEEASWKMMVMQSAGGGTFTLSINDATVIEKKVSPHTNSLATRAEYKGHEIILVVTYSSGFFSLGSGYEAQVFVDNELAAKVKI
jgi:hypothetical protein